MDINNLPSYANSVYTTDTYNLLASIASFKCQGWI